MHTCIQYLNAHLAIVDHLPNLSRRLLTKCTTNCTHTNRLSNSPGLGPRRVRAIGNRLRSPTGTQGNPRPTRAHRAPKAPAPHAQRYGHPRCRQPPSAHTAPPRTPRKPGRGGRDGRLPKGGSGARGQSLQSHQSPQISHTFKKNTFMHRCFCGQHDEAVKK